jgi:hypothetical protein
MIASIELTNFGSHKYTHIDWDKGFCVLSGESAAGKSCITRAIRWVVTNRPIGTSYINWGCFDKKDILIEKCSVTLAMTNGNTITRERSPVFNGYFIQTPEMTEPKRLEAVGSDVPEEVTKALGFTDVNCQKQFDRPFLIDMSSGDVAKYLNKLVNLEDADIYQTAVEGKRRDTDKELKSVKEAIDSGTEQLNGYAYLDKASAILEKAETAAQDTKNLTQNIMHIKEQLEEGGRLSEQVTAYASGDKATKIGARIKTLMADDIHGVCYRLSTSIALYEVLQQQINTYPDTDKITGIIKRIRELSTKELSESLLRMQESVHKYEENKALYDSTKNGAKAEGLCTRISTIQNESALLTDSIKNITEKIENGRQIHKSVLQYEHELQEVTGELSEYKVCPLCGKPLN